MINLSMPFACQIAMYLNSFKSSYTYVATSLFHRSGYHSHTLQQQRSEFKKCAKRHLSKMVIQELIIFTLTPNRTTLKNNFPQGIYHFWGCCVKGLLKQNEGMEVLGRKKGLRGGHESY